MTEVLFILTTIFVAYVIYVIVNEQKVPAKPVETEVHAAVTVAAEAVQAVVVAKTVATPKALRPAAKKPAAAPKRPMASKGGLRNPITGETATAQNNYRFTKRWIKEALVAEGLLDKIYKNNELDAGSEALIKAALLKLEVMDKYRA